MQLCDRFLEKTTPTEWIRSAANIIIHSASLQPTGMSSYVIPQRMEARTSRYVVILQMMITPLGTPTMLATLFLVFTLAPSRRFAIAFLLILPMLLVVTPVALPPVWHMRNCCWNRVIHIGSPCHRQLPGRFALFLPATFNGRYKLQSCL